MNVADARPALPRLQFVDSLRGFALLGVFGANLLIFSGYVYMTPAQRDALATAGADRIALRLELFLIENKFMGLFSMLFGISFWLFLDRARARGRAATPLFYRRIGWLFVFGAIHGWLLWCFDILRFYALWALLLPLFVRTPPRRLLAWALGAAILAPAIIAGIAGMFPDQVAPGSSFDALALAAFSRGSYPEMLAANWKYDWYLTDSIGQAAYQVAVLGRLLIGLYVARTLDLAHLDRHRPMLGTLMAAGLLVGAMGNAVFAGNLLADADGFLLLFARRFIVESGYLGFSTAFASGLALVFVNPKWTRAVAALAPLGQMALSAYLLETVFGIWLFYGFAPGPHLMGSMGPARLAVVWLVGYAIQVRLAHAWMRRFRFGPAEWLWRTLTYGSVQPMTARARVAVILVLATVCSAGRLHARDFKIGIIDLYGLRRVPADDVRRALTFKEGESCAPGPTSSAATPATSSCSSASRKKDVSHCHSDRRRPERCGSLRMS